MKYIDAILLILMAFMWSVFVVWELNIHDWKSEPIHSMTRFDLVIIPALILVTNLTIWIVVKRRK